MEKYIITLNPSAWRIIRILYANLFKNRKSSKFCAWHCKLSRYLGPRLPTFHPSDLRKLLQPILFLEWRSHHKPQKCAPHSPSSSSSSPLSPSPSPPPSQPPLSTPAKTPAATAAPSRAIPAVHALPRSYLCPGAVPRTSCTLVVRGLGMRR